MALHGAMAQKSGIVRWLLRGPKPGQEVAEMTAWRLALAILICSALGCASQLPPIPEAPSKTLDYHVAPPDELMISVSPEPAISRTVVIRPDGRISVDLIGDVEVEGKTVEEIREEITVRMREFIVQPAVTVVLSRSNSRQYYVLGEVKRPGAYPLIGEVDMVNALATAGGPTQYAKLNAARLVRPTEGDSLAYEVDFEEITRRGDATTNYELQRGDVVYVPPVLMVRIGYVIGQIFFPFQQILGFVVAALVYDRN